MKDQQSVESRYLIIEYNEGTWSKKRRKKRKKGFNEFNLKIQESQILITLDENLSCKKVHTPSSPYIFFKKRCEKPFEYLLNKFIESEEQLLE